MKIVNQCGKCGARDNDKHKDLCDGRKVKVKVYGKADYEQAKESGFNVRPVNILCFDNGGETADRYTLVRTTPIGFYNDNPGRRGWYGLYFDISANSAPYHPQGIGCTSETKYRPLWGAGQWGGGHGRPEQYKPIRWALLPEQVRRCAWDLAKDDNAE